ncbi:S4 domain-containing protein, partial [Nocardia cyriacigeorgica]|uniref:S4 domain-containing protein n=1 Tax=Nocardia cyriacigeorgica TaxID=135487 RepID=UPI0024544BFF
MNTPARRDGTPDRRKRNDQHPRGGRPIGSRDARAAQRGVTPRGAAPGADPRRGSGGTAGVQRGGSATPSQRGAQGAARRPDRVQPPRKTKTAKPQRQTASTPQLSNAKPAKRQHVEPAPGAHTKLPWGEGERLQKVLAKAGVASRRAAEDMIAQGRVEVDGMIVREQGLRIDPQHAVIRVDGTRVVVREELVHLALNKPKGWQSTMSDDLGRPWGGAIVGRPQPGGGPVVRRGGRGAANHGGRRGTNHRRLAVIVDHVDVDAHRLIVGVVRHFLRDHLRGAARAQRDIAAGQYQ